MKISPNKRIAINIFASYFRSIIVLVCGLVTGRWSLMALGEVDYGLLFLVGGMMFFVTFFNSLLAGGIARFYAYSVGESQKDFKLGLEKCRQWFNTALLIHTVLPVILVIIGFPLGIYAIRHWLTVPLDRVNDCCWVWGWSCISGFIGMITVPFNSFYYAKQYFFEPVIYSVSCTILNVVFIYYIVTHEGHWLVPVAIAMCIFQAMPDIILAIRAKLTFPECRINRKYLWLPSRIKELLKYSGWMLFGNCAFMAKSQCLAILLNKYFGPKVNSAMSISNHVSGKTTIFSNGMIGALAPAIANACGAKDYTRMQQLAFMACRFATMMTLFVILPVSLEINKLLELWLEKPPQYTAGLCLFVFMMVVIDQMAVGHMLAITANGKIALYQGVLGSVLIFTFPLAWILIVCGCGVYSIGISLVITMLLCSVGRVLFARYLVNMSGFRWIKEVIVPLFILIILSGGIGYLPHFFMESSILRIFVTGCITESVFCCIAWFLILSAEERKLFMDKINNFLAKMKKKDAEAD